MMVASSEKQRSSRLWRKPAFPQTTNMSVPASTAALFLLLICSVLVGMSDGVSVPISNGSTQFTTSTTTGSYLSDDDADLESLASSKILMDHTSSTSSELKITGSFDKNVRLAKNANIETDEKEDKTNVTFSGSDSTQQPQYFSSSSQKNDRNSYEMSSPLHVASCRATCLQKFLYNMADTKPAKLTLPTSSVPSMNNPDINTSAEDMHLLPMLRLRRRKRSFAGTSSKLPTSCFQHSSDCSTCWNTCELLEPKTIGSSMFRPKGEVNEEPVIQSKSQEGSVEKTKNVKRSKSKQSILACTSMDSKQCLAGCQVACSFYEEILTEKRKNEESGSTPQEKAFKSNPVVATKHESVVKIVPGKITWPSQNDSGDKEATRGTLGKDSEVVPVVYVVIQEYLDRKWRQIAQTTDTYIDIPSELTSSMNTKLRSVRVLAVGPNGLLSVYSPAKVGDATLLSDNTNNNLAKKQVTSTTGDTTIDVTPTKSITLNAVDFSISSSAAPVSDSDSTLSTNVNDLVENNPNSEPTAKTLPNTVTGSFTDSTSTTARAVNELGGVVEPFGLRVVSLIHQKSLVIAELKWDEVGGNPNQEYLITWELEGGGLKGHLVTDSTSVTLSLWPDTTYQIQVEQFEQNFDSDGEQPTESSSTSLQSLPLTVDTSEASFPMEQPSALLSSATEEEDEDDYEDEDVSTQEGNQTGVREEEDPDHKSISRGFLNMTLLLGITISALVFVLVILTVAAFTWTKMRAFSSDSYINGTGSGSSSPMLTPTKNPSNFYFTDRKGCCYNDGSPSAGCHCSSASSSAVCEPQPLLPQEEFCWDDCAPSPVYYGMALSTPYSEQSSGKDIDSFHYSYESSYLPKKKGPHSGGVAVISSCNGSSPSSSSSFLSGAPTSCSYWNYYNKLNGSNNMAYSLLGDDCSSSGLAPGKQLECPSSSFCNTSEIP